MTTIVEKNPHENNRITTCFIWLTPVLEWSQKKNKTERPDWSLGLLR